MRTFEAAGGEQLARPARAGIGPAAGSRQRNGFAVLHCVAARWVRSRCIPGFGPGDGPRWAAPMSEVHEMSRNEDRPRADIYARITEKIVADLEKGVRPWMRPWHSSNALGRVTRPLRHNGQPYSGMNVLLLWSEAVSRGFASPIWMTFRQAAELGGAVRKGETGSMVVFASRFTKTETDGAGEAVDREIPFLKAYTVFNVAQIAGLPDHFHAPAAPVLDPIERIAHADRFFANTRAIVHHGGDRAYYVPATDHIQMPPFATFRDAPAYIATLSHEATHWTAAAHRVNRDLSRYAKDKSERAREELVALS